MGLPGAYLEVGRRARATRPAAEAVMDFEDFTVGLSAEDRRAQASRCMNCGVGFCQAGMRLAGMRRAVGCPLHNPIPETNDLVFRGRMDEAAARLALTNPFPEFTGRVCPAPCEAACNLGLHDDPVTIHDNERDISDHAWEAGLVRPFEPAADGAPLVSVVGSGPAGLAAAWELARAGARVRVIERDERPGGLLMYGIPNMKLPKDVVERRCALMEECGIEFACGVDAAACAAQIAGESAAVVLACGSREPRRLGVPGARLSGVLFAVEYLSGETRALLAGEDPQVTAAGKDVAVIGGGDTGTDCVATALRQGARSVRQVVRAARPPAAADPLAAWPGPRGTFSQGYGQREAQELEGSDPRLFSTDTVGFSDDGHGNVCAVQVRGTGGEGPVREIPAQLVLVAKGFTGPEGDVVDAFSGFGNVRLAGDARTGSSIVAAAMADGIAVARDLAGELMSR